MGACGGAAGFELPGMIVMEGCGTTGGSFGTGGTYGCGGTAGVVFASVGADGAEGGVYTGTDGL